MVVGVAVVAGPTVVVGVAVVAGPTVVAGVAVVAGPTVTVTVGAVVSELPPQADATRTNAMTAESVLIP